jgi:hypothetical protein
MCFRRAVTLAGTFLFLFASAALVAAGCGGGSSATGAGGAGGRGGVQGTGGHLTGAGGHLAGAGGIVVDAGPVFPTCTPVVANTALILDFADVTDPAQARFGIFGTNFAGGTYQYPTSIVSTFTAMNWHLTGTVGDYSGFGLYLACKSDASAFTGIQLDISGTFGNGDGGTSAARVTMGVGTPVDEFDSGHASMPPTWGTCATGCASPTRDVPILATTTTFQALWSSFTGGMPVSQPDPTQLLYVFFAFPWSGTQTPYPVDVTIDNVMLMGGAPGDGGTPDTTAADTSIDTVTASDAATDTSATPTDAAPE